MGRNKHELAVICDSCADLAALVKEGPSLKEVAVFLEERHGLSASLPTIKSYIYEYFDRDRLQNWHEVIALILEREAQNPSLCLVVRDALSGLGIQVALPSVRAYIADEFGARDCLIEE